MRFGKQPDLEKVGSEERVKLKSEFLLGPGGGGFKVKIISSGDTHTGGGGR